MRRCHLQYHNYTARNRRKSCFAIPALLLILVTGLFTAAIAQPAPPPPCDLNFPGSLPSAAIRICSTEPYKEPWNKLCFAPRPLTQPAKCGGYAPDPTWSPRYYRFKCFRSGTFGFLITPQFSFINIDWQLYDITNRDPEYIFDDPKMIVTGNWSTEPNFTGAVPGGLDHFFCIFDPDPSVPGYSPPYSAMPQLTEGREYMLAVVFRTKQTSSYTITFEGGTASIVDPLEPHLSAAEPKCSGKEVTVRLNKKMLCSSLSADGSEFRLLPGGPAILSAVANECRSTNGFDEVKLTLASPLTTGNYKLVIQRGVDDNTILDICKSPIPENEEVPFNFVSPTPIIADSTGRLACTPDSVRLYFPKKIRCSSIAPDGSDFNLSGPGGMAAIRASGECSFDGYTDFVYIRFNQRVFTKNMYTITVQKGTDGNTLFDECGEEALPHSISFSTPDTVDADIIAVNKMGCRFDTLTFSHDGARDVNYWRWYIDKKPPLVTRSSTVIWPAKGDHTVSLYTSNGSCEDSTQMVIKLDNEVVASFEMDDVVCPEDKLQVLNTSTGVVDAWRWNFDVVAGSTEKNPTPFLMPSNNREAYYTVKLTAYNNTIGCSDSTRQRLTVLDNCSMAVPTGFTPNNDGKNDFFWPHNGLKAHEYNFRVYNRWGNLVFQSNNWRSKWDGKVNNILQPPGVYIWMLSYKQHDTGKSIFQKGTVMLIR